MRVQCVGGVSSFGYSGTIAHAVLRHPYVAGTCASMSLNRLLKYQRRGFAWFDAPHVFAQSGRLSADGAEVTISRAAGKLHTTAADHVVHGRVIFPGAGYLEMARAAAVSESSLRGVFFLQPLAVEAANLVVECVMSDGRFEVRSGEDEDEDRTVHCSGSVVTIGGWQLVEHASMRGRSRMLASHVRALYDGYASIGLQYGPGYRTLVEAWGGGASAAMARLRGRATHEGTHVHPADLDDALCVSALTASDSGGSSETRVPFAVDEAALQGSPGELWAVRWPRKLRSGR